MKCPHCDTPIDDHEASRCLDAWVAEVVMGETAFQPGKRSGHDYGDKWFLDAPYPNYPGKHLLGYSINITAVWEVVEKILEMRRDWWSLEFLCGTYRARFEIGERVEDVTYHEAKAATAPLAICQAAIKASKEAAHENHIRNETR